MKKTFFLLASGLSAVSGLRAQTSGWETGINLSGGASDQFFTHVSSQAKPFLADVKKNTVPKFYFSAGAYGRKFFKDMYGVEIGLQYTSFALGSKKAEYTDINGNQGRLWTNIRHNYVEMPVRFVFKKELGSVFSIGCFAGIAPAVLTHSVQRSVLDPYNGERRVETQPYSPKSNRFNLFADAGLLLRVNISSHFALDMKPFFRMSALPVYPGNNSIMSFNSHLLTGGATVSSVWKF